MASIIQILGLLLLVTGIGMISIPAVIITLGLGLLLLGISIEKPQRQPAAFDPDAVTDV